MNEVGPGLVGLGEQELEAVRSICSEICSALGGRNATMLQIEAALVLAALVGAPGFADCFGREFLETLKVHAMTKNMLCMALGGRIAMLNTCFRSDPAGPTVSGPRIGVSTVATWLEKAHHFESHPPWRGCDFLVLLRRVSTLFCVCISGWRPGWAVVWFVGRQWGESAGRAGSWVLRYRGESWSRSRPASAVAYASPLVVGEPVPVADSPLAHGVFWGRFVCLVGTAGPCEVAAAIWGAAGRGWRLVVRMFIRVVWMRSGGAVRSFARGAVCAT